MSVFFFMIQVLRAGFDREFELTEEVDVIPHGGDKFIPYVIGASIVNKIDEMTEGDGGVRTSFGMTNFVSCRYAKTDQILDAAREAVFELSKKSKSDARILIFAGLGDIRSEAFSGAWMANKVNKFVEDIDDFNKVFDRAHEFAFAHVFYPTGLTREKYRELDSVNRILESVNASLGKDSFAPGRKLYRDCAVDLKPNVYVGGEPKFSPVEFWRNRNDIHPSDLQLKEIDKKLRTFLKDGLRNPEHLNTHTGVTFKKKKRNFQRMSEEGDQMDKTQDGTEHPVIPGANWIGPKRSKPWSNRQREAEFEKKIEGLDEQEKEKKRKERKERQEQIEEDKKKKGREAKQQAEQDMAKRRQELNMQLDKAKKDGDKDRETALTASIMRLGTDI